MQERLALSIGLMIDTFGFESVLGAVLTHQTKTEPQPVEVLEATETTRADKGSKHAPLGAMQPGGQYYNEIAPVFFQFKSYATLKDVAKRSGHSPKRCDTVARYLIKKGELRREGWRLYHSG
jgi:hypothetical protein